MSARSIHETLERLAALLRAETRRLGKPEGLQPVQIDALLYLDHCNRYSNTPQAVAEYLGSTKGTTSQTLKVLESKNLLAKAQDQRDRRVVRLHLTSKGRTLATTLANLPLLESALSQDSLDAESLGEELGGLLRALQRAGGFRTFGTCRTCRFLTPAEGGLLCGLTREALRLEETQQICREHEEPRD